MSILGILIICVGVFVGNIIRFKGRKDYASIFELDIIIIDNKEKGDNNPNDFDNNKNYKKIKISKPDKYHGEREKFKP